MYRVTVSGDWKHSVATEHHYPSITAAYLAILADPVLRPDVDGRLPDIRIRPVERPERCTCYGRDECAACEVASVPVSL